MSSEQIKNVFIFLVLVFSISGFALMKKKLYFYICGSAGRFVLPLELTRPSHCLTDELWPRWPHFQSEWFTDWVISSACVCLWEKVRETKSDRTDVSWHGTVNPFRHEPGNYWCKRKVLICVLSAINSVGHQTQSVSLFCLYPHYTKAWHQHEKKSMCYLVHDFPTLCHSSAVTSAYCFLLVAAQQLGKKKKKI